MKSNPALPGGLFTSKPTWSSAFRVLRHVGFFLFYLAGRRDAVSATVRAAS